MKPKNIINNIVITFNDGEHVVLSIGELPMTKEMAELKNNCAKNEHQIKYLESLKLKSKEQ